MSVVSLLVLSGSIALIFTLALLTVTSLRKTGRTGRETEWDDPTLSDYNRPLS